MPVTRPHTFNSGFELLNHFGCSADVETVKNEEMFFNCDLDFARLHGGPITHAFIDALPEDWKQGDVVFDSRVHMLMPGDSPAIPGYHHDDIYRRPNPLGQQFNEAGQPIAPQPDYDDLKYKSEHIMGLVNAHVAPTIFAKGKCTMPAVPEGDNIYRLWHDKVEELIESGEMETFEAPDRQLIGFSWQDFHTGQPANQFGWRWFGRVSRNTDRVDNITNEIRRNANVYKAYPTQGW